MPDFTDKVVIVTGASSGIGAATGVEFARAGATVVLVARRTEGLQRTAEKCHQAGASKDKVLCVPADLTNEEQCKNAVQEAAKRYGKINVLVNNAGAPRKGGILETTVQDMEDMFNVHVKSTYVMSQACLQYLVETKGNIVNMGSVVGTMPAPRALPYSMAKAAVQHLTKSVALEMAPKGVRCNVVCPAVINTEWFTNPESAGVAQDELEEFMKKAGPQHPMGRVGEAPEVAAAILFLASDAASFTTGCCFPVDGGKYISMLK